MTWFRVDDGMWGHPKFAFVSNDAIALWVMAGSWSMRYLTDGLVPPHALAVLRGSKQAAQELVDAGIWDVTPDGYLFHDFAEYQFTKTQVLEHREKERDKKRRQRAGKTNVPILSPGDTEGTDPGTPQGSPGLVRLGISSVSNETDKDFPQVNTSTVHKPKVSKTSAPSERQQNFGKLFADTWAETHPESAPQNLIGRAAREAKNLVDKEGRDPERVADAVRRAAAAGNANVVSAYGMLVTANTSVKPWEAAPLRVPDSLAKHGWTMASNGDLVSADRKATMKAVAGGWVNAAGQKFGGA